MMGGCFIGETLLICQRRAELPKLSLNAPGRVEDLPKESAGHVVLHTRAHAALCGQAAPGGKWRWGAKTSPVLAQDPDLVDMTPPHQRSYRVEAVIHQNPNRISSSDRGRSDRFSLDQCR